MLKLNSPSLDEGGVLTTCNQLPWPNGGPNGGGGRM